jgi:glycosyltransferase involved in cell wall biosynthesis
VTKTYQKDKKDCMEPIKISIVIPCYNVGKYIRRGLDSIIAQTLQDWEAILVDDGATDDTGEICDEYVKKDDRFNVVHTSNQGLPSARNTGMEYVHGELLAFMDPDDWIENECFSKCYEAYEQYNCDIVYFGLKEIYSNKVYEKQSKFCIYTGSEIWSEFTCQHIGLSQKALNGYFAGEGIWNYRKTGQVWRYMFRNSFVKKNNLQFHHINMYEDLLFMVIATYKAKMVVSIPYNFYNYFMRNDGLVKNNKSIAYIFEYKYKMLEETKQLRSLIKEFDLHDYYMGSHVLSCLKMALLFSKKMGNYKLYHKYVSHPEVQESIRKVCLKGAPLKFSIPVRLLKIHCPWFLFAGCWILNKIGNTEKLIKSTI